MLPSNVLQAQLSNVAIMADWLLLQHSIVDTADPIHSRICMEATALLHYLNTLEDRPLPCAEALYHIQQRYHRLITRPIFCIEDGSHSQAICDEIREVAKTIETILNRLVKETRLSDHALSSMSTSRRIA